MTHTALLAAAAAAFSLAHTTLAQDVGSLYKANCVACHGERGEGSAKAPTFLKDALFEQSYDRPFFDMIKNGKPGTMMKGFTGTLTDPQAWGLVNYIRELQSAERRSRLGSPKPVNNVFKSQREKFKIEAVVESGVAVPWAVDFLPDGRMLVTERAGEVRISQSGTTVLPALLSAPIAGTPTVRNNGQGGMLDVAVHPDYAKADNGWIYLSFADPSKSDNGKSGFTKVVRGRIRQSTDKKSWQWTDQATIFEAKLEHYINSGVHFGSRFVFSDPIADGPDKGRRYLYFGIGERGQGNMAQDLTRPNGKIYRVFDDGGIPSDNPFINTPDAYKAIYSYGHRNPQGLVKDLDGKLWDTEHAPRGGDELNLIEMGKNYGWPLISFGINYSGEPMGLPWPNPADPKQKDLVMPVLRWLPSIAACGLTVSTGEGFPEWKGDLFAGGLAGQTVQRLRIKDGQVVEHEELLHGMGRVRDVFAGPGGAIYVVFNEPDRIVRLTPAE